MILIAGIFLRIAPGAFSPGGTLHFLAPLHPESRWNQFALIGVDENLYREYVDEVSQKGLAHYPDVVVHYIEKQLKLPSSVLPPVRFLYIFFGYIWHSTFGGDTLDSLKNVSSFFSILTLGLSCLFGWRMRGCAFAVALAALMSFAPTQIHMSQHALVDGFFTFWALLTLWTLWENLHAPRNWAWLASYSVALACLVLTKENSFFVWVALVALLIANRWLQFGTVTRELVIATLLGPLLGVVVLIFLTGGLDVLWGTYRLLVTKNYQLPYAMKTGDGPWSRYLVDLVLVSPIVVLLAVGGLFRLELRKKPELFMLVFVATSYLVMCNVKYAMNLRYANMWDMPLRVLAISGLSALLMPLSRHRTLVFCSLIGLVCAVELRQYFILFVHFPLYELVTEGLLRALSILK